MEPGSAVDNASLSSCVTSCSSLTQQHGDRKLGQSCLLPEADTRRAGEWLGQGLGEAADRRGQLGRGIVAVREEGSLSVNDIEEMRPLVDTSLERLHPTAMDNRNS
ncbi:hypothetical protein AAFF_G00234800 [Aldrovandia affinis]|uniref:Uncharacterized protein n=1 Tax=Aldrovandia affinis TaxID=143900 RepID=A0AAD7SW57_9TELE|nr:hypothetical protein AAFF_G00234800 [Aldrovandia affinis]